MSEDRNVQSGERRLERIRAERGMPVRRAPIAAGALVGGALGAWIAGVPAQLLATVRAGIVGAAVVAPADGGDAVRGLVTQVAAIAWPAFLGGLAGATVGALAQTGFRVRSSLGGWRMQLPSASAAGGAPVRLAWAFVITGAAACAVWAEWPRVASMPAMPIDAAVSSAAHVMLDAVLAALGAGAAFAAADVALARWRWERATRMTDAEAREERRRADGDPETKSRRMQAARRTAAGLARGKELRGQAA
jgi:hypothetical protein